MEKVLITDDCHPLLHEGLEREGYTCVFEPGITLDEVKGVVKEYEGLIINSKIIVDRAFLSLAPRLKFIARLGSGMEIVDRQAAAERGVAVFSSPEGNCNAVAEHAMGMLLALLNNLLRSDAEVRRHTWQREANRGTELGGKTIGIIGFGHTGTALATKLQGWDVRILAYDKYKEDYTKDMPWVQKSSREQIQKDADIISLHLPLGEETRHYFDQAFIKACRRGVILVNTSRGACVDTAALVEALDSGQVGGACLDVFENEKPHTYNPAEQALYERLFKQKNVILSPHVAGWTHESKRKLAEILLQKIVSWRTSFLKATQ